MKREHLVGLALALVVVAGSVPGAAQSLEGQAESAVERSEQLADDTADDPAGMAANASNASWQGHQVNRTVLWTCDTARAVDEDVGEQVGDAADCQARESVEAGEDEQTEQDGGQDQAEEANRTKAKAEEAEADAERAVRDEVAAAEAFVDDTAEDPENAPSHLETFVNRTLIVVNRTVAALEELFSLPADGVRLAGERLDPVKNRAWTLAGSAVQTATDTGSGSLGVLQTGASLLVGAIQTAGSTVSGTAGTSVGVVDTATGTLAEGVSTVASQAQNLAQRGLGAVSDAFSGSSPPEPGDGSADKAVSTAESTAEGVVDQVPVETP